VVTDDLFEVADPSGLTDADWAEINKLKVAYSQGGKRAFDRALRRLEKDHPIRYAAVVRAFFSDIWREAIRDAKAEQGITVEDLWHLVT
jgi:hypothetical protein